MKCHYRSYAGSKKVSHFSHYTPPPTLSLAQIPSPSCHRAFERRYERKIPPAVTEITHSDEKETICALRLRMKREVSATLL